MNLMQIFIDKNNNNNKKKWMNLHIIIACMNKYHIENMKPNMLLVKNILV